jgi:hypothetical protein
MQRLSDHLIHTDAVLDAPGRRVAGCFLRRGSNASDEGRVGEAMTPEPFVSAEQAAQFLSIKRRYLRACAQGHRRRLCTRHGNCP